MYDSSGKYIDNGTLKTVRSPTPTLGRSTAPGLGSTSQLLQNALGNISGGGAAGAGGTGAGGGGGAAGAGAGGATNTAQYNPDISFATSAMKERYAGDNGANRAIDLAMGKIRDSAEGERRAAAGRREARGVSGTGVDSYDERRIGDNTQRAQAGAASDIAFNSEQAKTGLLSGIASAGVSQGNLALGERDLAIRQQQAQQQNEFEAANARRAQEMAILQMLSNMNGAQTAA